MAVGTALEEEEVVDGIDTKGVRFVRRVSWMPGAEGAPLFGRVGIWVKFVIWLR